MMYEARMRDGKNTRMVSARSVLELLANAGIVGVWQHVSHFEFADGTDSGRTVDLTYEQVFVLVGELRSSAQAMYDARNVQEQPEKAEPGQPA